MLKKLYNKTMSWAAKPQAPRILAMVSFIESSVFPIPPDVMLVPMILANRARAWVYAAITTIASVLGGLAGYAIGAFFFMQIGAPILTALGKGDAIAAFNAQFNAYGAWVVLIAGLTPFPFKVITIMSGWSGLSLPIFILSAVIARGLRFYIVAALLWRFGPVIRDFIERRLSLVFFLFLAALIGGFYAVRLL